MMSLADLRRPQLAVHRLRRGDDRHPRRRLPRAHRRLLPRSARDRVIVGSSTSCSRCPRSSWRCRSRSSSRSGAGRRWFERDLAAGATSPRARHHLDPDRSAASPAPTRSVWSQREFVTAARAQGAKNWRIMSREVLPNVVPAMFSIALLGVAVVIVAEAALQHPRRRHATTDPSWGDIINDGFRHFLTQGSAPTSCSSRSALIFFTVLALNYLGDAVTRTFDVREGGDLSPRRQRQERRRLTSASPPRRSTGRCSRSRTSRRTSSTPRGLVRAVDGVSASRSSGAARSGIVGESGSGKTVLVALDHGASAEEERRPRGLDPVRGPRDRRPRRPTRCATSGARRWRWSSRTR